MIICTFNNCHNEATYRYKYNKLSRCEIHKNNMMDHVNYSKTCKYSQCNKSAIYALPGNRPVFCATHKIADMINVKIKQCTFDKCTSKTLYGKPGSPTSHCGKHRQPGMIKRPNGKCINCTSPAIYGNYYVAKHCEIHKEEHEQNLVERNCISCNLIMVLDKDNYCEYCNPVTFATARLAKQNALMDFLDSKGLHGTTTDTVIDNGVCGKERPDRVFDFEDKIVVLECDEHQHRDRLLECENVRMINISQSFGGIPVYFIRWNPDDYSPIDDSDPLHVSQRHLDLYNFIIGIKNKIVTLPNALLSVFYMFYDGWYEQLEWLVITHYTS